jgi:hypothetical protein
MLEVVIDVYLTADSLCSNDIVALWHMPSLVDFTRVVNLNIK